MPIPARYVTSSAHNPSKSLVAWQAPFLESELACALDREKARPGWSLRASTELLPRFACSAQECSCARSLPSSSFGDWEGRCSGIGTKPYLPRLPRGFSRPAIGSPSSSGMPPKQVARPPLSDLDRCEALEGGQPAAHRGVFTSVGCSELTRMPRGASPLGCSRLRLGGRAMRRLRHLVRSHR